MNMKSYELSPAMQNLVYWSGVYTPAGQDIESVRAAYDAMCEYYTPERDEQVSIQDHVVHTAEYDVPVRLYFPEQQSVPEQGWSCILYMHGGGYVVGGLDSHEFFIRHLCADLKVSVVSVDYRLAPEHVFPAAYNDCMAVYQWIKTQSAQWQINPEKVILAGDSAGGNLSTALAVNLQHTGQQAQGLALIYPGLNTGCDLPSYVEHAHAPLLSTEDVHFYLKTYAPDEKDWKDTRLAPLNAADFSDMPASFISVAEYDPLRDDGKVLAEHLQQAGIEYSYFEAKGLLHGGLRSLTECPEVQTLYQKMVQAIGKMLD